MRARAIVTMGLLLWSADALAADPTKDECVDANVRAQTARREGKLSASRAALLVCVNAACPAPVRDDCTKRLDDLERAIPTVIFEAKDAAGHDLSQVRVTLDGRVIASRLDGMALAVDVGAHEVTFETDGKPTVTQRFVFAEGDKGRHERVVIADAPATAPPPAVTPTPSIDPTPTATPTPVGTDTPPESSGGTVQRVVGVGIGALGLIGIGTGIAFAAIGSAKNNAVLTDCPNGTCTPGSAEEARKNADRADASTFFSASYVGFIAGGAAVIGGLVVLLTAPSAKKQTALRLWPDISRGQLFIGGRF